MTDTECVIFAFGTFWKSADAVFRAIVSERFATSCYDLVGICLVAYVKYQLVLRCVKYVMQAYDKFNRSEAGTEVSGIDSATFYHVLTYLLTECAQLLHAETFDVSWRIDLLKEWKC